MSKIIYFDNASTTPIYKVVKKKILKCFKKYGNYSSFNYLGNEMREYLDKKIYKFSKIIFCNPNNIIWTSCATESNNIIIYSLLRFYKQIKVICISTEHASIINCLLFFKKEIKIIYINPDKNGNINKNFFLKKIIIEKPLAVFSMYINNETGIINDIKYICKICRKYKVFLHIDCSQIVGKIKFKIDRIKASSLTFSSHKCHGPKGIGFLYFDNKLRNILSPIIIGGGQQNNFRSGTIPVHQIIGLYKSFQITIKNFKKNIKNINFFNKKIISNLKDSHVDYNVIGKKKVPHIINVSFKNINNDLLILNLKKIIVSKGSACNLNHNSYVLKSMGYSDKYINSSIRISFGNKNNVFEVNEFNKKIISTIRKLLL
ncbi:cysteine desulfurase family protein [Candidatus Vidania fulgoroideorum]